MVLPPMPATMIGQAVQPIGRSLAVVKQNLRQTIACRRRHNLQDLQPSGNKGASKVPWRCQMKREAGSVRQSLATGAPNADKGRVAVGDVATDQ